MVGRSRDGEPLVGLGARSDRRQRGVPAAGPERIHLPVRPAGPALPARRAHPAQPIRATPTCRPGEPGILSLAEAHAGLRRRSAASRICVASTRFHRLLRRGREYGAGSPAGAGARAARRVRPSRACTSSAWAPTSRASSSSCKARGSMGTKFDGLRGRKRSAARPSAAGPGRHAHRRLLDAAGRRRRTGGSTGLPQFVTVLGGAYFFLPGIRALRYLATARMSGVRHELEHQSSGAACQYRLGGLELGGGHVRSGCCSSSAASIPCSARPSMPCCAIRSRGSPPR